MRNLLVTTLLLNAALGCQPAAAEEPPGTALGTFHVKALIKANDCGAQLDATTSSGFDIVLSQDDTATYWTQNGSTLVGSLNDDEASFSDYLSTQLDAKCTLRQDEAIQVTLDDLGAPTKLSGSMDFLYDATSGSNCGNQTVASGGEFENLPCSIRYAISAVLK